MKEKKQIVRPVAEGFPLSVSYFSPVGLSSRGAILQNDAVAEFRFICIRSGLIQVGVNDLQQIYAGGDFLFIPPWTPHSIRSLQLDTHYISLKFSPDLLSLPEDHFFQKVVLKPILEKRLSLPLSIHPGHPAHAQLEMLAGQLNPAKDDRNAYSVELLSILFGFFAALLPHCTANDPALESKKTPASVTRQVMQYLKENYSRQLTMAEISAHVHLHPNYLSVLFKKATGDTVMTYLNRVRLDRACYLLRHSNLPIGRISELCGYQSPAFFTRRFRQELHYTPSTFRKRQPPER